MDTQSVTSWRTSTYTGNGGGTCVEVGHVTGAIEAGHAAEVGHASAAIAIRDTKNHGTGPVLTVPATAWRSFTATLK